MKLNHLDMKKTLVNDYLHKPTRKHALALHKLYTLEKVHVPNVIEILIHRVSLSKYFDDFLKDLEEYETNYDEMNEEIAMCNFLDIDYDGIVPYDPSKKNLKF